MVLRRFQVRRGLDMVSQRLLENGARPTAKDKSGITPYHIALQHHNDDVAALLLVYMSNCKYGMGAIEVSLKARSQPSDSVTVIVTNVMLTGRMGRIRICHGDGDGVAWCE